MKLLWIDLNSSYAHSSLALPALHAQAGDEGGVEWHVLSATVGEPMAEVVARASELRPDAVAATCWLFNRERLLHIVARVKAVAPRCVVLMGGPEFLGDNEEFLRAHRFVTAVLRGEGEEVFPRWLKVWDGPRHRWDGIEGLCYLDERGAYRDNGTARIGRFDRLAPPESSRFFRWDKPFVQLETTRGCFNTCAFCVSGGEKPVRALPIEAVERRLRDIHGHGVRDVRVLDRTFNYNGRRAKELLDLFRRYPDTRFHLEIHPALMSDGLRRELAEMPPGLLHLEAGIQSLRGSVLERCGRTGGIRESMDGLRFLCSLPNMETHADLIAGLPLYRLDEIFDDARTLAGYGAAEIQLETLKVLPGTDMRRRAEEWGVSYAPLPPYEVLETRETTAAELQTAARLSRLLDGFYNAKPWRKVVRRLIVESPLFLRQLLDYLTGAGVIDTPLSMERRGLMLYDFCKTHYPHRLARVSEAWIEAGMSLKKAPAENVRTKRLSPPPRWTVVYGSYDERMRLCFLPEGDGEGGLWFGFETDTQRPTPAFKAVTP